MSARPSEKTIVGMNRKYGLERHHGQGYMICTWMGCILTNKSWWYVWVRVRDGICSPELMVSPANVDEGVGESTGTVRFEYTRDMIAVCMSENDSIDALGGYTDSM